MLSLPRPLNPSEQGAALHLWQTVFDTQPGYFERYFEVNPYYRPGDTLGVWDGDLLVSAVHLCRRPVRWHDSELLCGAVANVATLPDYRRQGLSRALLSELIAKMEAEGFHYSLLGTGTPTHYAALGWMPARRPQAALTFSALPASDLTEFFPVKQTTPFQRLYEVSPRLLQFRRDPAYFENWVGWEWRQRKSKSCVLPERGYLVLSLPENTDEAVSLVEWRAENEEAEGMLFQAAIAEASRNGHTALWLDVIPQFINVEALQLLGTVTSHLEEGTMIRNISLSDDDFSEVAHSYQSGQAAWWPGDGF